MSKTIRKVHPKLAQSIRRNQAHDEIRGYANNPGYDRRNARILRGNDGAIGYDKCQTAQVDSEGGFKLDTWSECHAKHHGKEAKRKARIAGKLLIRAQLA